MPLFGTQHDIVSTQKPFVGNQNECDESGTIIIEEFTDEEEEGGNGGSREVAGFSQLQHQSCFLLDGRDICAFANNVCDGAGVGGRVDGNVAFSR